MARTNCIRFDDDDEVCFILSLIFKEVAHGNNSTWIDTSLHSDKLLSLACDNFYISQNENYFRCEKL